MCFVGVSHVLGQIESHQRVNWGITHCGYEGRGTGRIKTQRFKSDIIVMHKKHRRNGRGLTRLEAWRVKQLSLLASRDFCFVLPTSASVPCPPALELLPFNSAKVLIG